MKTTVPPRTPSLTPAPDSSWRIAVDEQLPPSQWLDVQHMRDMLGTSGAGRYGLALTEPRER
jgi:hypothetical protein